MKVSKLQHPTTGITIYRVYIDNGLPHEPINLYLRFLDHRNCSPNTSRSYAFDLIRFFEFLKTIKKDWIDVDLEDFVDFTYYLQHATQISNISILPTANQRARGPRTINRHVSTLCGFYTFHQTHRNLQTSKLNTLLKLQGSKQRFSFLSFAKRSSPSSLGKTRLPIGRRPVIKNKISPIIDHEVQKKMVTACSNNRDKMLILLLLETGMRIGQALQLRHDDIESWNGKIKMQYRTDNLNDTYAKTKKTYYIHVSKDWLNIYTNVLINNDTDADYIFTKLYRTDGGDVAEPLKYGAVKDLFSRISNKLQIKITPHMLRHTHATELLRSGVSIEMVSKRLGHSSIETTKQAYEHLTAEDIKSAILEGHDRIDKKRKEYVVERITSIES